MVRNDFKLNRRFREIHRTTVFGCGRMLRMEKAWMMIETGALNVDKVALGSGYTCFGHFAGAFRKRFGITPSEIEISRTANGPEEL
jgi:transcriptional regulator GlxA family with amidase domain